MDTVRRKTTSGSHRTYFNSTGHRAEIRHCCFISWTWGLTPLNLTLGSATAWVTALIQPCGKCPLNRRLGDPKASADTADKRKVCALGGNQIAVLKPTLLAVLAAAQWNCKIGALPASGWQGMSCHVTRGNQWPAHCGPRDRHVAIVTVLKDAWHSSLKHSGNYIYHYSLTLKNSALYPHKVFLYFVQVKGTNGDYILQQYSPGFTVFHEVGTEF
jgi:hypothetical protein